MGTLLSTRGSGTTAKGLRSLPEDQPWIMAIRDPEVLDWKCKLSDGAKEPDGVDASIRRVRDIARGQTKMPVKISKGLFLSDAYSAMDVRRLETLGITHVLNVGGRMAAIAPAEAYKVAGIAYKIIEADDVDGYPMLGRHFEDARRFIDAARRDEHNGKSGACLVHCLAGMNRSGVIVAAYHMLEERANVLDVVRHCRRMRGNVFLSSNNTFQEDLVALARREDLLGPKPSGPFPKYFS